MSLTDDLREGIRQHGEAAQFYRGEGEEIAQAKADMVASANAKEQELEANVNEMLTTDVPARLNSGLRPVFYIDTINGNDANDGLSNMTPIKTDNRLYELSYPDGKMYYQIMIYIAFGSEVEISGRIFRAFDTIYLRAYGDNSLSNPKVIKIDATSCGFSSKTLDAYSVDLQTYKSAAGETISSMSWVTQFFFGQYLLLQRGRFEICDTQVMHKHGGGSGDSAKPYGIYLGRLAYLLFIPSEDGVVNKSQYLITSYGSVAVTTKLDLFSQGYGGVDLGGVHDNLSQAIQSWNTNYINTNLSLS